MMLKHKILRALPLDRVVGAATRSPTRGSVVRLQPRMEFLIVSWRRAVGPSSTRAPPASRLGVGKVQPRGLALFPDTACRAPVGGVSSSMRSFAADAGVDSPVLIGKVKHIFHYKPASGWCSAIVLETVTNESKKIVGIVPDLKVGDNIECWGDWKEYETYGSQLNVSRTVRKEIAAYGKQLNISRTFSQQKTDGTDASRGMMGLKKYVEEHIDYIGEKRADLIVDHFGKDTFDILSGTDAVVRLQEIPGIGSSIALKVATKWEQHKRDDNYLNVLTRLSPYGISRSTCLLIVEKFGSNAVHTIDTDPYKLYRDIKLIGFETADRIALSKPNCSPDSPRRVDAALYYILDTAKRNGDTALQLDEVIEKVRQTLDLGVGVVKAMLQNAAKKINSVTGIEFHEFHDTMYAQLAELAKAEKDIATFLTRPRSTQIKFDKSTVQQVEEAMDNSSKGFKFSESQIEAIKTAVENGIAVVTGGPGTGKTKIIPALRYVFKNKAVAVVAPTGKAAQKISKVLTSCSDPDDGVEPQTIHRLLGYESDTQGFFYNKGNRLLLDCVVIDESSMVDVPLAASLIRALPDHCCIIIVGDVDQLPSIGPGNLLCDIIKSKRIPCTRLETIFRQSEGSMIIECAHAVNKGKAYLNQEQLSANISDLSDCTEFQFVDCQGLEPKKVVAEVASFFKKTAKSSYDVQIIAPMHKGESGIKVLNDVFQTMNLNPMYGEFNFKVGDKVMVTRNNYDMDVFNGTVGTVKKIFSGEETLGVAEIQAKRDLIEKKLYRFRSRIGSTTENALYSDKQIKNAKLMVVDFDGDRSLCFMNGVGHNDLTLAYAISVHKSQGSEYPLVIIVLTKSHWYMLQRRLLYTAITRAKGKVVIVGEADAYNRAVQHNPDDKRVSLLYHRLIETVKLNSTAET
jgi:exodeoxyribonuclease V alpha subunit